MRMDVARALPSGTTDVEPARAFLQDRIRLWTFWVFVLSSGFYAVNLLTWPFVRRVSETLADVVLQTGNLDHLAASLVFGGVYVLMRVRRLSLPALRLVDVGTLLVGCTLFALMGAYIAYNLRNPCFASTKAFYTIGGLPCFAILAGLGLETLMKLKWLRPVIVGAIVCVPVWSVASYFIVR